MRLTIEDCICDYMMHQREESVHRVRPTIVINQLTANVDIDEEDGRLNHKQERPQQVRLDHLCTALPTFPFALQFLDLRCGPEVRVPSHLAQAHGTLVQDVGVECLGEEKDEEEECEAGDPEELPDRPAPAVCSCCEATLC